MQIPDTERAMELHAPATALALGRTPPGEAPRHLAVSTACGTTTLYALPELTPLARWAARA